MRERLLELLERLWEQERTCLKLLWDKRKKTLQDGETTSYNLSWVVLTTTKQRHLQIPRLAHQRKRRMMILRFKLTTRREAQAQNHGTGLHVRVSSTKIVLLVPFWFCSWVPSSPCSSPVREPSRNAVVSRGFASEIYDGFRLWVVLDHSSALISLL